MPTPPLVLAAALLGLAVGSALELAVVRVVQADRSGGPSRPTRPPCAHRTRPRDHVPVLAWRRPHRAGCPACGTRAGWRRPLVETATAALFAGAAAVTGPTWALPALLHLAALAVVLTPVDVALHRLPDAIVLPAYPTCAALLALASWNPGGPPAWDAGGRAALGGAALLASSLGAALAHPGGLGLGDVKLAGVLGLCLGWFGWDVLVVGAAAASVLGALHAVVLLTVRGAGSAAHLPFGPWMLAGALAGIAVGEPLGRWYLGLGG
jgi:leader peptidase (prepilin peptidase) / N-methyltransferase